MNARKIQLLIVVIVLVAVLGYQRVRLWPFLLEIVDTGTSAVRKTPPHPEITGTFRGHSSEIVYQHFSSDSRACLTQSRDGATWVWNLQDRWELRGAPTPAVFGATIGSGAIVVGRNGVVAIWPKDLTQAPMTARISRPGQEISGVTLSPDQSQMVIAHTDNRLEVWDLGKLIAAIALTRETKGNSPSETAEINISNDPTQQFAANGEVCFLGFDAAGTWLAAGAAEGAFRLYEVATGQQRYSLRIPPETVRAVAFHLERSLMGVALADGTGGGRNPAVVEVWDLGTGVKKASLVGHSAEVVALAFSPDGQRLVTGARDRTARIWDIDGRADPLVLSGYRAKVASVAFSPDGESVLTGSSDGTARLYDSRTGEQKRMMRHTDAIVAVAFSADGAKAFAICYDGTTRIWTVDSGAVIGTIRGGSGSITCAAFSPDGCRIVTGYRSGAVILWNPETSISLLTLDAGGPVTAVRFSPDGHVLAAAATDKITLWHGEPNAEAPVPGNS